MPPRGIKNSLTVTKDEFTAMWTSSLSTLEIASRCGRSESNVVQWAARFGLPPKATPENDCEGPMPGDPTPEEIEELKAYANARRIIAKRFNFEGQDTIA